MAAFAAGAIITASGLWIPGQKLISIPKRPTRFFVGDMVTIRNQTWVRACKGDTVIGVMTSTNRIGTHGAMEVKFPFSAKGPLLKRWTI